MNYQTTSGHKQNRAIAFGAGLCPIAKPTPRVIAFIDTEVFKNPNSVVNLDPATELFVIDSTRDGIEQITEILTKHRNIKSLQIIASFNGNEDSLKLGLTQLNIHTLQLYIDDLQQWRNALSSQSEILIYGCLVLVESIFQNFIHQLGRITGADVGAFVIFPDSFTANQDTDRYSLMVAWRS